MTARLPELVNARIERKARTGKKKAAKVGGLSHWGGKQPRLAKRAIHNPTTGSQSRIDPAQKMAANCFRHLQIAQRKEAREEFLRALKLRNRHAETWISSLEAQPAVNQRRLEVPKYPRAKQQSRQRVPTAGGFAFVPCTYRFLGRCPSGSR